MIFDADAPIIKQLLKTYLGHVPVLGPDGITRQQPALIFEDAGVTWPIPLEIQEQAQQLPGFAAQHEKIQVQWLLRLLVARAQAAESLP